MHLRIPLEESMEFILQAGSHPKINLQKLFLEEINELIRVPIM